PATIEGTAKEVKDLKDDFKDFKDKSFKSVQEQLNRIETSLGGIDSLRKDMEGLRRDIDNLNRLFDLAREVNKGTKADCDGLKAQVGRLEESVTARLGRMEEQFKTQLSRSDGMSAELSDLRKKVADGTSTRVAAQMPTTGNVRIRNTYNRPVHVI